MELGKQIKKHRTDLGFSQDQLAEKVYVSRQSISNWENDKTYPDIKSLLLLSDIFSIPLDQLVKEDMEEMKKNISEKDIRNFNRLGVINLVLFPVVLLTVFPLTRFLGFTVGAATWAVALAAFIFYVVKTEYSKKSRDIDNYLEIMTFMDGEEPDNTEKEKIRKKRLSAGIIGGVVTLIVFAAAFILCGL